MFKFSAFIIISLVLGLSHSVPAFAESSASDSSLLKTKMDVRKEDSEKKRVAFKEKVALIKDQRKKQIVERIDVRIPEINTNRTTQMTKALSKMTEIIDKVSTKAATAKTSGKNTLALEKAILNAKSTVLTAQTAVTLQSTKTYALTFSNETTMKTSIASIMNLLMSDLKATHQKVLLAKESVQNTVLELAKIQMDTHSMMNHSASGGAQ